MLMFGSLVGPLRKTSGHGPGRAWYGMVCSMQYAVLPKPVRLPWVVHETQNLPLAWTQLLPVATHLRQKYRRVVDAGPHDILCYLYPLRYYAHRGVQFGGEGVRDSVSVKISPGSTGGKN